MAPPPPPPPPLLLLLLVLVALKGGEPAVEDLAPPPPPAAAEEEFEFDPALGDAPEATLVACPLVVGLLLELEELDMFVADLVAEVVGRREMWKMEF